MRAVDVPRSRPPAGRALEPGEIRRLFAACAADPTPAGSRDGAAVALRIGDYDRSTGALRVIGKGNRQRTAFAAGDARRAIDA